MVDVRVGQDDAVEEAWFEAGILPVQLPQLLEALEHAAVDEHALARRLEEVAGAGDGAGGAVLTLAEPDIALISLSGGGPRRFGIFVTDGGAANRLHVQILRTR